MPSYETLFREAFKKKKINKKCGFFPHFYLFIFLKASLISNDVSTRGAHVYVHWRTPDSLYEEEMTFSSKTTFV